MSVIPSDGLGCPDERTWDELASGLVRGEAADRLLTHASTCDACAHTLRLAIEVFGPEHRVAELAAPAPSQRRWLGWAAAAAAVLVSLGAYWFLRHPATTPLTELARSYTDRRTIPLRIPGAGHAPLRLDRSGPGGSLTSQSPELLEQAARIARLVREGRQNATALHAKGRLALLEWKPAEAIEALRSARDLGAAQPDVLIDLATAYFERAEQRGANGAADLTLAQDLLGQAIQQHPRHAEALFNRALIAERLQQIDPAIRDLELALQAETQPAWISEIRLRLAQLRRQRADFFDRAPEADRERFAEAALDAALAEGLASLPAADAAARRLTQQHHDPWLTELTALRREPRYETDFRRLARFASIRLSSARARYTEERAEMQPVESATLPAALAAWRDFEVAYRATHSNGAFACRPEAPAPGRYAWLAAQMAREAAICESLAGSLEKAVARSATSVDLARAARLPITEVRNEAIAAALDYRQGRYREVLMRQTALVERIFRERLPITRAHEPLHNVVVATAALGRHHASHQAALMAAAVADRTGLQSARFADRINAANAAWRAGDRPAATGLFREALSLRKQLPVQPSMAAWAEMTLGELEGRETLPPATEQLLAQVSEPSIRLPYARLVARRQASAGQLEPALRTLEAALAWLVQAKVNGTRHLWRDEYQATTAQLLHLLVRHRPPAESFAWLQKILEADEQAIAVGPLRHAGYAPQVTYSLRAVGEAVYVWRQSPGGIELRRVSEARSTLEPRIRRLRGLAGERDSSPAEIAALGRELSAKLFGPWLSALAPQQKILFQAEGMLAEIPFSLLVVNDQPLGLQQILAVTRSPLGALSQSTGPAVGARLLVDATHVATLAQWQLPSLPSPGAELQALQGLPGTLTILEGVHASQRGLRASLPTFTSLHFAGHAVRENGTIGLLLADGVWRMREGQLPAQVILSACATGRSDQDEADSLSAGTLAHAFILGGAAEVLGTAWNLDTEAGASFMQDIYAGLTRGDDFGIAMLHALRQLHQRPPFAHPYYWAGHLRLLRT